MKSLEIVNEMVDYWESAVNVACQSNAENGYYDELDIVEYQNRLKKYQQIKQDLEVLEIIKKIFGKANFHFYPNGYEADILLEDNDICIEAVDRITKLKVADVKKLKQWLEENENGNE